MEATKKLLPLICSALILVSMAGCRRGDLKVDTVFKNQPAPFSGWNIGPEMWIEAGDPVLVDGVIIWTPWLDLDLITERINTARNEPKDEAENP